MQGVVPAAGRGTRLRPLTDTMPKGLVPVHGRPLLSYCFDALTALGLTELIVIVGYRGNEIIEQYGFEYDGVPITYVRQREPIGIADALLAAEQEITGTFVLLNGDNILRADLDDVVATHRANDAVVTMLVDSVSRRAARRTGVLEFDADGSVAGIVEKPADPPSQRVTTGFSVAAPILFKACRLIRPSADGEYELSAAIDLLFSSGHRVATVALEGWRANVNTPEDRARATEYLAGQPLGESCDHHPSQS